MSFAEQDAAIRPSPPGERKIVLATTIAETSLTIDGIGAVIDTGFKRVPRFDPASGMTALETVRVSLASADQRRGRAGRLGPGIGYRLWPEAETRALKPHDEPEIFVADLAPLVLELAAWGVMIRIRSPGSIRRLPHPSPRRRICCGASKRWTNQGKITPWESRWCGCRSTRASPTWW
jgi:ATP-dependent helicase HrpB